LYITEERLFILVRGDMGAKVYLGFFINEKHSDDTLVGPFPIHTQNNHSNSTDTYC